MVELSKVLAPILFSYHSKIGQIVKFWNGVKNQTITNPLTFNHSEPDMSGFRIPITIKSDLSMTKQIVNWIPS